VDCKNYAGGFLSVAKDLKQVQSRCFLNCGQIISVQKSVPLDGMHMHGYWRVLCFKSRWDTWAWAHRATRLFKDVLKSNVVGHKKKCILSSFLSSSSFHLPPSKFWKIQIFTVADETSYCINLCLMFMVLKKLQVLQSRSKNAQRVILLFNVLDIIFCLRFAFKIRLSTSSPRKAWMAWSLHRPQVRTAPSSNPWLLPWSASHRGLSTAWRVHCPR